MTNPNNAVANLLLKDTTHSLPVSRQGAVAIRKLELQLTPYPAFFRELKEQTLLDVRADNPDAIEQIEAALDSAAHAIELHLSGLRVVTQLLNNNQ